ncbi:NAD(P)-dependent oxidoreductase [Paracoccus luteus]|uniref:NAD(P)-dependent oxidoreductase n=1 Tax=Paracoccus luteus TaxID=2508543 RepID=UPI00106FA44A|nr:NAD(P)-dependent oxidoreductase [Paracoccus luteus]
MATQTMLKFVTVGREMPEKRTADERADDFHEIYREFAGAKAAEQASRCSQCGVPYCQSHCPLHNNIPDWLRLTAEGRLREAHLTSQATNTFPEICGRICPQDRLCEGNCVIEQSGHGTVTIGAIEKYINDTAWQEGWVEPIRPLAERGESVGIIGAGPGGLAAADRLRRMGFQVTVYDRHDRAGGLMIYGIPGFKLEKHVVERRTRLLSDGGVEFVLNAEVGRTISFDAIRGRHDAVLIATGVYKTRDLDIDNAPARGVVAALDYLTASNRVDLGDEVPDFADGELNAAGKRVVVIGGGDTAMDCVRTAIRQGAASVKCLYRRDRANMPGSQREVQNAEEEGVEFVWLSAPNAFAGHVAGDAATADEAEVANDGGDVDGDGIGDNPRLSPARIVTDTDRSTGPALGLRVTRMRLGAPDVSGRQMPEAIEGADYHEPADLVIKALGFEPEELPRLWGVEGLEVTRWGTIRADFRTHATSLPGVWAVGDIVRGASLVVWAIRDGREAADAIAAELGAATRMAAQ